MSEFVNESLQVQVNGLLKMEDREEDLTEFMDSIRAQQEALFTSGLVKRSKRIGQKLKARPPVWDSDVDGEWEDQPIAWEISDGDEEEAPANRRKKAATAVSDDDESAASTIPAKKAPAKKAPAKPRAAPKAKAPTKAVAKAVAKAPAARGRKKVVEPSDDEDSDVVMMEKGSPATKSQPKRAAAAKGRQTTLNFTQSQGKTQTAIELSDDEISDDAFEPMATSSRRK
jgi:double-strand break repair protein MRE11